MELYQALNTKAENFLHTNDLTSTKEVQEYLNASQFLRSYSDNFKDLIKIPDEENLNLNLNFEETIYKKL